MPDASSRGGAGLSILHIIAPASFGGMERVVTTLAAGQLRQGHRVQIISVLSPGNQPHPFVAGIEAAGIESVVLRIGDRDYLGERRAVREVIRDRQPDLVHTHGFRPDVTDGGVARSEGLPVVSTCHGFIDFGTRGAMYQWLQRRALRKYDAVIAVSALIVSKLKAARVPVEKIHLVPNAFADDGEVVSRDAARRALDLPDVPVIGWVGRLSAEKGPDIALEAFAQLDHPMAVLVFIGDGRERAMLESRATTLGIRDRVLWRGAVANVGRLFPAFDAFLLSSRTEGTPMVLLEAMSARVPIIATKVGGVPDVVSNDSAWLVEALDVDALASSLRAVIGNPESTKERVDRAQATLRARFSLSNWLAQYEKIYRSLIPISRR